jgi:hypothetical protein
MKKNLVLSYLLAIILNGIYSCNDSPKADSTSANTPDSVTQTKIEPGTINTEAAEAKNYSFYKLPKDIADNMKGGEAISSDELEKFKVQESVLKTSNNSADCVVHDHSTITCTCKAPDGKVTTKTGTCDVYYANESGKWVYCYTRCESCINVCNK